MIHTFRNKINAILSRLDEHTLEVVKKSSASMVVKVFGMIAGLLVSIFLGRTLGPDGLGIINLANRIVGFLLVFTMLGMDNVLVKRIAIAFERKEWKNVKNSIFTASGINGSLASVISLTGVLLSEYISNVIFNTPQLQIPLIIAFTMMLPQTFSRIFAAGMTGFRKIWQSNLVNETLSMWVIGILLLTLYFLKFEINVVRVALVYAIGRLVVTVSVFAYWEKIFRFKGNRHWIARPMMKMALPLLLVTATSVIAANADTIMLGWLSNTREVGLYSVAARLAFLTSFFLQVSNAAISPKLATLFAEGKITEINKMVQRVTGGLILIASFVLAAFILGGHYILSLWGMEFKEAYWILVILGTGQFLNIATGCSGLLLVMCGQEKVHGYISLVFVLLNLLLNYFLILNYGAKGAAIATAVTVGGENITKLIMAKKKTGVLTLPNIKN